MGIFEPTFNDPLAPKIDNTVKRLRFKFTKYLNKIHNHYILRKYTDELADNLDKLTKESPTGNKYKYIDHLIKAFTNQKGISDSYLYSMLDMGINTLDAIILYINYNSPIPKINDRIFEIKSINENINIQIAYDNDKVVILNAFKITHIIPYYIQNKLIYYKVFLKE